MSDIKERLRKAHAADLAAAIEGNYDSDPIFTDALSTIEALEAMVAQLQMARTAQLNSFNPCDVAQQHAYWSMLGRDEWS